MILRSGPESAAHFLHIYAHIAKGTVAETTVDDFLCGEKSYLRKG